MLQGVFPAKHYPTNNYIFSFAILMDDKIYAGQLKEGNIVAFDTLFRKYSSSLYAFALSITRDPFASEEITQLVFLKVWEKRMQLNDFLSFKSFLFSVAYNETISWMRKEASEKRRRGQYAQIAEQFSYETESTVEFKDIVSVVNTIIDEMPEKRKEIFKLSREQGFSNKEIADKLDISVKTVENQMTSALKYLRKKLSGHSLAALLLYWLMLHQ